MAGKRNNLFLGINYNALELVMGVLNTHHTPPFHRIMEMRQKFILLQVTGDVSVLIDDFERIITVFMQEAGKG
jgi:hypothetical protein